MNGEMQTGQRYRRVVPLIQVSSIEDSLAYYRDVLGFTVRSVWPQEGPARWARVARDDIAFVLSADLGTSSSPFIAEKGNGVVFYIIVDDPSPLYDDLVARGAIVVQELHDFGGRLQFSVADLNGYVLAFSQEMV